MRWFCPLYQYEKHESMLLVGFLFVTLNYFMTLLPRLVTRDFNFSNYVHNRNYDVDTVL